MAVEEFAGVPAASEAQKAAVRAISGRRFNWMSFGAIAAPERGNVDKGGGAGHALELLRGAISTFPPSVPAWSVGAACQEVGSAETTFC